MKLCFSPTSPYVRKVRACAIMGMTVFLGLRFGVWGRQDAELVATHANELIARGLKP